MRTWIFSHCPNVQYSFQTATRRLLTPTGTSNLRRELLKAPAERRKVPEAQASSTAASSTATLTYSPTHFLIHQVPPAPYLSPKIQLDSFDERDIETIMAYGKECVKVYKEELCPKCIKCRKSFGDDFSLHSHMRSCCPDALERLCRAETKLGSPWNARTSLQFEKHTRTQTKATHQSRRARVEYPVAFISTERYNADERRCCPPMRTLPCSGCTRNQMRMWRARETSRVGSAVAAS